MKTKSWILKLISISFGFSLSFLILEIFARILPANNLKPILLPLKCDYPLSPDINCLIRRESKITGVYTKGNFPPLPIKAIKKTNDIGQFSDVDLETIKKMKIHF